MWLGFSGPRCHGQQRRVAVPAGDWEDQELVLPKPDVGDEHWEESCPQQQKWGTDKRRKHFFYNLCFQTALYRLTASLSIVYKTLNSWVNKQHPFELICITVTIHFTVSCLKMWGFVWVLSETPVSNFRKRVLLSVKFYSNTFGFCFSAVSSDPKLGGSGLRLLLRQNDIKGMPMGFRGYLLCLYLLFY